MKLITKHEYSQNVTTNSKDRDLGFCDLLTPLNIPKSNMFSNMYILLTGANTFHIAILQ